MSTVCISSFDKVPCQTPDVDIPSIPGWGPVVLPNLALSYVACCAPVQGRDEIEGPLELGVCELDNHMMSTIIITNYT